MLLHSPYQDKMLPFKKNVCVPKILPHLIRPLFQLNLMPLPGSNATGRLITLPDIFRELPLLKGTTG